MLLSYFWANKDLYSVLHMINIYLFTVGLCNRRRPPFQHNTFCNSRFAPPDPTRQKCVVASHRAVRTGFNSRLSKENMWTEFRRQRKTSVINLPRQSSSRASGAGGIMHVTGRRGLGLSVRGTIEPRRFSITDRQERPHDFG